MLPETQTGIRETSGTIKILVIDDEQIIRESCQEIFNVNGYQVITADNGNSGFDLFQKVHPDLILLDLKMPDRNGLGMIEEISTSDPNCIVIIITGFGTIESAVEAMRYGAYDFLSKPFTPDELRVTVKRGIEKRNLVLRTEALSAEKRAMRENFVNMASHELRSPLSAILQNLMVINEGLAGETSPQVKNILNKMNKRLRGLIKLVSDWLDASRIEEGEIIRSMNPVDIKTILMDVIDLLGPLALENQVKLICHIPENYPTIIGNAETLHMCFTNLIHNGIKYNKSGGCVEITLKDENRLNMIMIQDTGVGIPEEQLAMIFEEFFRCSREINTGGSGLGLSIVKKIVEAHSGTIKVESKYGEGTLFTVQLP